MKTNAPGRSTPGSKAGRRCSLTRRLWEFDLVQALNARSVSRWAPPPPWPVRSRNTSPSWGNPLIRQASRPGTVPFGLPRRPSPLPCAQMTWQITLIGHAWASLMDLKPEPSSPAAAPQPTPNPPHRTRK
jgi:hypothetical protein